ncbi:MAG: DUF3465 domain-containing protein [Rhodothermales bacterium]|nr:DUF3465 domain-containing protein [Rhodothermales bacterium]
MGGRNVLVASLLVLAALAILFIRSGFESSPSDAGPLVSQTPSVESLYERGLSDQFVEFEASVIRILEDDNVGSRHQRFIVRLASGHTVLVSHNIDLAPRVPLAIRDALIVRGEYEWNDQGGVVHWTHHDPDGRMNGGWIEHNGVKYR